MMTLMNLLGQTGTEGTGEQGPACPLTVTFTDPERLTLLLCAVTAVIVIGLFLRQRKIAQNQIELAELLKELIEKK